MSWDYRPTKHGTITYNIQHPNSVECNGLPLNNTLKTDMFMKTIRPHMFHGNHNEPFKIQNAPTRMLTKCGIESTRIIGRCSKVTNFAFEEKYPPLSVLGIWNDGYLECFLIQKKRWSRLERILEFMEAKTIPHSMSIIILKTPKYAWWSISTWIVL
jgi:hypothetical protein